MLCWGHTKLLNSLGPSEECSSTLLQLIITSVPLADYVAHWLVQPPSSGAITLGRTWSRSIAPAESMPTRHSTRMSSHKTQHQIMLLDNKYELNTTYNFMKIPATRHVLPTPWWYSSRHQKSEGCEGSCATQDSLYHALL